MISENLSHDSKVWTKKYDMDGKFIPGSETGIKDIKGGFIYDNLPRYQYVDVEYDRFKWTSKTPNGPKTVKKKVGTKVCRYAQFPDGQKAIMPSILEQLLAARKATRVLIKYKTVITHNGEKYEGLLKQKEGVHKITQKNGESISVSDNEVKSVEDTYDDFMKNVFNKRQLGYKITANSLYGQCGAKTSDFMIKILPHLQQQTEDYCLHLPSVLLKKCMGIGFVIQNMEKFRRTRNIFMGTRILYSLLFI